MRYDYGQSREEGEVPVSDDTTASVPKFVPSFDVPEGLAVVRSKITSDEDCGLDCIDDVGS